MLDGDDAHQSPCTAQRSQPEIAASNLCSAPQTTVGGRPQFKWSNPSPSKMRTLHVLSLLASLAAFPAATLAQTPNTLLIIADDFGADALGIYGLASNTAPTPNIDALAAGGVRFENAYACPTCSPTRACLLTGSYGFRTGVGFPIGQGQDGLAASETLLPEALVPAGVTTALMGKWHLGSDMGPSTPTAEGFDVFTGTIGGAVPNYSQWMKVENQMASTSTAYVTTDTIDESLTFISQTNTPWFVQVSLHVPHTPYHAPPANLHTQDLTGLDPNVDTVAFYKAMVESMDTELGRLLASIPAATLANTNIVFVGDNGTANGGVQPPFNPQRSKGTIYQNGIRVPLIFKGPAVSGSPRVEQGLAHVVDLFPTLAAMQGVATSPEHGVDLTPLLQAGGQTPPREFVFTEQFTGTTPMTAANDQEVILDGRFTYLRFVRPNGSIRQQLFDLNSDPLQLTNLINQPLSAIATEAYRNLWRELATLRAYAWHTTFGDGCSGGGISPTLGALSSPTPGANFTLQTTGLSGSELATVGAVGFTDQTWNGVPLPVDLTAAGFTGCSLHIDPILTFVAVPTGTSSSWTVALPNNAALIGQQLFAQAFPLLIGANPAGMLATNAVEGVVGN
ncbi:MAG: arylsulfatase B [Planctomycetota bacterium]|jgi:arylsulfatase B